MAPCSHPYPIVVTTNSGYPLDQNLYQAVKGMSAAAQVVERGGLIITAAECRDGFPEHGNFKKLLLEHDTTQALLQTILAPGFSVYDQWEAQLLGIIAEQARIALFSTLAAADVRRAHMEHITDVAARVSSELDRVAATLPLRFSPRAQ